MIIFMTHDQALIWSRLERLLTTMGCMGIIYIFESLGPHPTWIITVSSLFVGQLIALKCWIDMIIMKQPNANCWAFKEGE